jgi:hypothetical protein
MRTTRAAVTSPTAQDLHSLGVTRQEGPTSNCTSKANLTSIRCHTLCCLVSAFFKIARRGLSPAATLGWRFGEYSLFLARCPKPNARTPRAKRVGPGRRGASTRRVGPRCPHSLHRSLHRIGQKRPATSIGICGPMCKIASTSKDVRRSEGSGGDVRRTSYTLPPSLTTNWPRKSPTDELLTALSKMRLDGNPSWV